MTLVFVERMWMRAINVLVVCVTHQNKWKIKNTGNTTKIIRYKDDISHK